MTIRLGSRFGTTAMAGDFLSLGGVVIELGHEDERGDAEKTDGVGDALGRSEVAMKSQSGVLIAA